MNDQERSVLQPYLMILVEADEPSAVLGALQRVAELRARSVRRGKIELDEAVRWDALARVLAKVMRELKLEQSLHRGEVEPLVMR